MRWFYHTFKTIYVHILYCIIFIFPDENGWPQPQCDFPDEFAGTTWKDLAGRHVYEIDGRERGRVLVYSIKRRSDRTELKSEYRCIHVVSKNITSRTTIILSYINSNFSSLLLCLVPSSPQRAEPILGVLLVTMVSWFWAVSATLWYNGRKSWIALVQSVCGLFTHP